MPPSDNPAGPTPNWAPAEALMLSSTIFRSTEPSKFLHSQHLQLSPQKIPAWKHSQYFLRHPDFLHAQPYYKKFNKPTFKVLNMVLLTLECFPDIAAPAAAPPAGVASRWLEGIFKDIIPRLLGPPRSMDAEVIPAIALYPPIGEACGGRFEAAIFGLNAFGFLSSTSAIVFLRMDSFSMLLQHPLQLQFLQYSPLEKHSQ